MLGLTPDPLSAGVGMQVAVAGPYTATNGSPRGRTVQTRNGRIPPGVPFRLAEHARRTAPSPACRKRPRPCEKSKSWVADPAASRLEHDGGLATATPISRGVSRVGRVRDCCDRLTARFGLIVALEAGEIGVQPAAAAIIVGSPARLIARRML